MPKCDKCGEGMKNAERKIIHIDGETINVPLSPPNPVCINKKCPNYALLQVDLSEEKQ